VRVEWRRGRERVGLEHVGTGRTAGEVALLVAEAWGRVNAGQEPLWTDPPEAPAAGRARTVRTWSEVLWDALDGVWGRLGFEEAVPDQAFKSLALARLVEPTSKVDAAWVLADLGQWGPSDRTVHRCVARCQERGYREALADACWERAGKTATLLLCDVTTLRFESDEDGEGRVPGSSKKRRSAPPIVLVLMVDQSGFPVDVRVVQGSAAEAKTIVPVVSELAAERGVERMTVVADPATLAESDLVALEDAGFSVIVGPRTDKAPGSGVSHHHQLLEVEESFSITKSDIRARSTSVRARPSIEAHLTMVFAGLAVSRTIERDTGVSIQEFVRILQPVRTAEIAIDGAAMTAPPDIPEPAANLLAALDTPHTRLRPT
jgi:hypothetical protein